VERVVVTGLGVVSPVGQSPDEFFDALLDCRSGVRLVCHEFGTSTYQFAGATIDFDASSHWPQHQASQFDRATQFALFASKRALADASLSLTEEESFRAGVYWGTGLGGATSIEDSYKQLYIGNGRVRPTSVVLAMNNAAAGNISIANGFRGPVVNVSTACSSSATAIGEAYRAIGFGFADVVVCGGSEALVTYGNLRAWDAMQALARPDASDVSRSCKPFSANRTGIVLGEGAAALILESESRATKRGARIYAEVVGYGNSADAQGISKPDASGQVRAMTAALEDARINADDVDYLNAHGTATAIGDVVETKAIKQTFGCSATALPISSTKALHGHVMGGTGAIEMLAALCALQRGVIPPTAHLECPDPACDLDYTANVPREARVDVVMSNSFGFGGMNSVLVARRFERTPHA